jgi:hypothetical protein
MVVNGTEHGSAMSALSVEEEWEYLNEWMQC